MKHFFPPIFLHEKRGKKTLKCTNRSWNASYLLLETTMFAISYLVNVRILSVSSISHLFHAIKRHCQADEEQEAADQRRHRVKKKKKRKVRAPSASSEATACLHPRPGAFSPERGGQDEEDGASIPAVLVCAAVILPVCQGLLRSVCAYIKQQTHASHFVFNYILLKFSWTDTKCNWQDRLHKLSRK